MVCLHILCNLQIAIKPLMISLNNLVPNNHLQQVVTILDVDSNGGQGCRRHYAHSHHKGHHYITHHQLLKPCYEQTLIPSQFVSKFFLANIFSQDSDYIIDFWVDLLREIKNGRKYAKRC